MPLAQTDCWINHEQKHKGPDEITPVEDATEICVICGQTFVAA